MDRPASALRDTRRWLFTLSVLVVAAADMTLPSEIVVLGFLVIPIVGSAVVADTRFTPLLGALAVVAAGFASAWHGYPLNQTLVRLATLVVAAWVATRLAGRLAAQRDRLLNDVRELTEARALAESQGELLRVASEAALEPRAVLQGLRDDSGVICDFRYIDLNPAACQYLGLTRDELVSVTLQERAGTEIRQSPLFQRYADCITTGEPVHLDNEPWPDGSGGQRYIDIRAARLSNDRLSLTWRDVTDRHLAAQALEQSEERFRLLAANSSDVVMLVREGVIEWVSPSITPALDWPADAWVGKSFAEHMHADDQPTAAEHYVRNLAGQTLVTRVRMQAADGAWHWVEAHSGPYSDESGSIVGIVASFRIIDSEVEIEQELERRATFDDLTGALKRNGALARLQAICESKRHRASEIAVLFLDLDEFKQVNDSLGHAAGDLLLQALVQRIRAIVRGDDLIARMGGDEFLVLLEGLRGIEDAESIAEKIRLAMEAPVPTPAGEARATLSIGVALSRRGETADALIARADEGMYAAKAAGRNRITRIDG